jgi:hypothetical protein
MHELKAQPLSAEEMASITALHERRLGWSCLLEILLDDRAAGFLCEEEESLVRDQLAQSYDDIARWFERLRGQYGWPSFQEMMWEIDFAGCRAVPRANRGEAAEADRRHERVTGTQESSQPVMYLGSMDATVIQRLFEERATLVDYLRPLLCAPAQPFERRDEVAEYVRRIGVVERSIRDWFTEMAQIYHWPPGEQGHWVYQVDIGESRVYRAPYWPRTDQPGRQDLRQGA